jgi:hypothetical protein
VTGPEASIDSRNRTRETLIWGLALVVLAAAIPVVFVDWLALPRRLFLVPQASLTLAFAFAYLRRNRIDPVRLLSRRWRLGLGWGAAFSLASLVKVFSHAPSATAQGWRLAVDLLWSGAVYAVVDATLLTVLPVLIVMRLASIGERSHAGGRRIAARVAAFAFSLVVATAYHLGFPEYRNGPDLGGALVGNGVMTVGYLVSGSVLTPMTAHLVLHAGAVLRGPASTTVLPPH